MTRTLWLTESVHYHYLPAHGDGLYTHQACSTILPGPIDEDYARRQLGDSWVDRALGLGVLRPTA